MLPKSWPKWKQHTRFAAKRAHYEAKVRGADAEDDKIDAGMNAYLESHHGAKGRVRRSGSWVDAILDLLRFFKLAIKV
jgi:hypothetical protein